MDTSFKFKKEIKEEALFSADDKVLAAVSGGIDSSVLLDLMAQLKDEIGFDLIVVHVNHKLRGRESDRDEKFVAKLSKAHGLRFASTAIKGLKKAKNLQSAARDVRYDFFKKCAAKFKCNKIALGHTADDQAETVLLHLVRGAGISGLTGMAKCRELANDLSIVRPLLDFTRAEIVDYAKERQLSFVEDSTNASNKYSRNLFRHDILKPITDHNPMAVKAICRTAAMLAVDDLALNLRAKSAFLKMSNQKKNEVSLDLRAFLTENEAIQSRVIRLAFEALTGGKQDLLFDHVAKILSIARSKKPLGAYSLSKGVKFNRNNDSLRLQKLSRS